MAKIRCRCGAVIRDDDPRDSMFFLTNEEFDVNLSSVELFGRAKLVVRCKTCARLWFWGEDSSLVEYVKRCDD
jgi:hypothetical protein